MLLAFILPLMLTHSLFLIITLFYLYVPIHLQCQMESTLSYFIHCLNHFLSTALFHIRVRYALFHVLCSSNKYNRYSSIGNVSNECAIRSFHYFFQAFLCLCHKCSIYFSYHHTFNLSWFSALRRCRS